MRPVGEVGFVCAPRTMHIFLSYAREDQEFAIRLARTIEARGDTVWWDRDVPPGKTFNDVIEEALEGAYAVIVLWSRHSVTSNWMRAEADEALRRGILVPVLMEDVRPPLAFRRIEAAELQGWAGEADDAELKQLLRVLEDLKARGPLPPPPPAPSPQRRSPPSGPPPAAAVREPAPSSPPRRGVPVWVWLVPLGIGLLLVGGCTMVVFFAMLLDAGY